MENSKEGFFMKRASHPIHLRVWPIKNSYITAW